MLPRDRDRQAARERLRRQRHQRDHARAAEAAMPLVEFYRQRPGLPLPPGPPRCPADCPHCTRLRDFDTSVVAA